MSDKLNILHLAVDSLSAKHMSCYGYHHQTTPHLDLLAQEGVLFEQNFCPHVPTTSGYGTMLTGLDEFGNTLVALRHEGTMPDDVKSLPEILREHGYESTCVGFQGNPAARGFDNYINFTGWGGWDERPLMKADNLNAVAIPELKRLAGQDKPFYLFLRHMDPHSPYLPPMPFERMFYSGDECDPNNHSLEGMKSFKPFCDYLTSWMPPGITDAEYVVAQYDGAIAYMDASIQAILTALDDLDLAHDTLVILNADHGETLAEHECWFDHHGMYDCTLHVPLVYRLPGLMPEGVRIPGITLHQDLVPTLMNILDIEPGVEFDGKSQLPMISGDVANNYSGFYITECTWMRKHGWRTGEWKLHHALEPDFHFKPEVELYNLLEDPDENVNVAEQEPLVVQMLEQKMQAHIEKRERETGRPNPIYTNLNWHGAGLGRGFESSQEAYDTLYIGSPKTAAKLQDKDSEEGKD